MAIRPIWTSAINDAATARPTRMRCVGAFARVSCCSAMASPRIAHAIPVPPSGSAAGVRAGASVDRANLDPHVARSAGAVLDRDVVHARARRPPQAFSRGRLGEQTAIDEPRELRVLRIGL